MRDAAEVLDLTLELPVRGKTYKVLPPPAAVGVRLSNNLALGLVIDAVDGLDLPDARRVAGELAIETSTPDFARECLGQVYDEMLTDDVPAPLLDLAIGTAFLAWTAGREVAETYWETGGKAPAPNRRRPTVTPTRQAGATSTPSRASRTTTRTTATPAKGGR